MRSTLAILAISLIAVINLNSTELSSRAERAIEQYQRELQDAREEYQEQVTEAYQDLTADLERAVEYATRRGDLDQALAIRERLEQLNPAGSESTESTVETDLLGKPIVPEAGKPKVLKTMGLVKERDSRTIDAALTAGLGLEISKEGLGRHLIQTVPAVPRFRAMSLRPGLHVVPEAIGQKARGIGLVSRDYGGAGKAGDYIDDVTITINGQAYTTERWEANTILVLPIPGGFIQEFEMQLGSHSWDPRLESMLLFE